VTADEAGGVEGPTAGCPVVTDSDLQSRDNRHDVTAGSIISLGPLFSLVNTDYEAVVYDLDGTLVRLDVDWDAVARDVDEVLRARDVDTAGRSLWEMLEQSDETGHRDAVEAAIAEHERTGAHQSQRLALADELPLDVPVGVCSLNCEAACRIALETHEIDDHVETVVGRDSLSAYKPDPTPLQAILDEFGVDPATALFVGDSESDRTAARRASMDFQWVRERQSR